MRRLVPIPNAPNAIGITSPLGERINTKTILTIAFAFAFTVGIASTILMKRSDSKNEHSTNFSAKTVDGFSFEFRASESEQSLIVFFASWCAPCIQETPSLIKLSERKSNWRLILISRDSVKSDLMDFIKIFPGLRSSNISLLWDAEGIVAKKFGVKALPESFLLEKSGKVTAKMIGATDWDAF